MAKDLISAISTLRCHVAPLSCVIIRSQPRRTLVEEVGSRASADGHLAAMRDVRGRHRDAGAAGNRRVEHLAIDRRRQAKRLMRSPIGLIRGLICLFLVALLSSCVWAPGQSMTKSSSGSSENGYVKLVSITPTLLETQEQHADAVSTSTSTIPTALLNYRPEPYRIGPGDSLYITVWDHPELTSPAGQQQQTAANGRLVRPDGTVYFPYAGVLKVAGKTIEQARQSIASGLAHFIKNPLVDVSIENYASQHVSMEGAFVKSGPQPLTGVPLTLGEAIGVAGVNSQNADLSDVVLTRDGQTYHLDLNTLPGAGVHVQTVYLQAGDRIYLPYNFNQEVYVMGEVLRPQALRFTTSHLTLTQALGQAGGLNEITSRGMVYVVRGALNKQGTTQEPTVYELDAKSPSAFALADNFVVRPGDVVFASAAGVTRWNRFMSQLLPLTSALSATASSQYYINNSK
ncbi:polysaccharide biosynthesis/export family protein [Rhodanobacter sp. B05]|uniref:polysaccharide biosynthesis/export family protein n=1 Tax=Rhodanobacter sp. B05 TaxID=1945859 RepID=UPI0026BC28AD